MPHCNSTGIVPGDITAKNFFLEVSKGSIPGHEAVSIVGVNNDVGSGSFEDIWDAGGNLVYPTTGETWEILSDDVNDTSAGTGARTVLVSYLDDSFIEQNEIVTLNGTTPVTLVATDSFRQRRLLILTAGSGNINAGKITLRVSGGGNTRGQILIGNGNSLDSHYTVPAGKTAFIIFLFSNINKNEDIEMKLISTIGEGVIFSIRLFLSVYQNSISDIIPLPAGFPEKSDLNFQAISSDVNAKAVVTAQFIVVRNEVLGPVVASI